MAEAKAYKLIPHSTKDTITYEMNELVRCKDCKHRGNPDKCVLSAYLISRDMEYPLFIIDNRGNWFCADGKRKDGD